MRECVTCDPSAVRLVLLIRCPFCAFLLPAVRWPDTMHFETHVRHSSFVIRLSSTTEQHCGNSTQPHLRRDHRSRLAGRADRHAALLQHLLQPCFRAGQVAPAAFHRAGDGRRVAGPTAGQRLQAPARRAGPLVAAADDAAGAAHPGPGRQLSAQHRALGRPAHQLLRLLRADAGHLELPELRRHLRHGADTPAEPGPGQPDLLHGHHDQPAHRHLRHHPEGRARPAALGRRCASSAWRPTWATRSSWPPT